MIDSRDSVRLGACVAKQIKDAGGSAPRGGATERRNLIPRDGAKPKHLWRAGSRNLVLLRRERATVASTNSQAPRITGRAASRLSKHRNLIPFAQRRRRSICGVGRKISSDVSAPELERRRSDRLQLTAEMRSATRTIQVRRVAESFI
jgi:hypothetical protein